MERHTDGLLMTESQLQRTAFDLAKAKGWDPTRLTPAQNKWIAVQLRSTGQLIKDGAKALTSVASTLLSLRVVSDEKAVSNEGCCRGNPCGKFAELTNSEPVCMKCQCSGGMLRSKWKDATQFCPDINPETGQPYWSNLGNDVGTATVLMPRGGDMNASGSGSP